MATELHIICVMAHNPSVIHYQTSKVSQYKKKRKNIINVKKMLYIIEIPNIRNILSLLTFSDLKIHNIMPIIQI